MPPTGYLTVAGIESCLQYLASTYPSICKLIVLPETSVEGRTSRAIKIANGSGADRHGVLFIGGVHAREIVNPDMLVSLALKLCQAYTNNTGLTFGGKSYSALTIKLLVNGADIFIFPLVNPDGRFYVQSPTGDAMWRKNRRINAGTTCRGTDLNRNFDFLWSSTIGNTSSNACSLVFKGPSAFSEPETRNVRHLLDAHANICCMIDVHSFSQLILHPWGDDESQTTTPSMNFMNPAFNGLRGVTGDSRYKEYIPQADLDWLIDAGVKMRDAISAVRGRVYTVQQSVQLYPTSGTSKDYAFSRHFVDASKRKVYAYTVETGLEFQPPYSEALNIISEVSSGLIQFCLSCMCIVEEMARGTALEAELVDMRNFRDQVMLRSAAGRKYAAMLEKHSGELIEILVRDAQLRKQAVAVLQRVQTVAGSRHDPAPKVFTADLITVARKLAEKFAGSGSPALQASVKEILGDTKYFLGKTILNGIKGVVVKPKRPKKRK